MALRLHRGVNRVVSPRVTERFKETSLALGPWFHRLALNEWALQHRYAMTLHTDDEHRHVHVVLKAVSEQGVRLNIRKSTLRSWRAGFAANLRELGVDANATERAVRGQSKNRKLDGIYRAALRGQSTHLSK